jgi:hypothetical protein
MTGRVGISRSRLMDMMLRRRSLEADEIEVLIEEITRLKTVQSRAIGYMKRADMSSQEVRRDVLAILKDEKRIGRR